MSIEAQLLGQRLRQAREAAGKRQADVAADAGIAEKSLGRYERGEVSLPATLVGPIAESLGLTPGQLARLLWPT